MCSIVMLIFLLIALEKVLESTTYLLSNIDLLDKFSEAVVEKEISFCGKVFTRKLKIYRPKGSRKGNLHIFF